MTLQDFLKLPQEEQWKEMVLLKQQVADQRKIMWRLYLGNIVCIVAVMCINWWTLTTTPAFAYYNKDLKELPADTMLLVATGKMNVVTRQYTYLVVGGGDVFAVSSSHSLPPVFSLQQYESGTRIIDQTQPQEKQQPILGPEI